MNLHLIYLLVPKCEKSSHFFSAFVDRWISWFLLCFVTIQALMDLSLFGVVHWYLLHIEKLPRLGYWYVQIILLNVRLVWQLNILRHTCFISWRRTFNFSKFRYDIKQNDLFNWFNCFICQFILQHIQFSFDSSLGLYQFSILFFQIYWKWNFRFIFYSISKWLFIRAYLPNLVGFLVFWLKFGFYLIWRYIDAIFQFIWWCNWIWIVSFIISWDYTCIMFWRQKCRCHVIIAFFSCFACIFLKIWSVWLFLCWFVLSPCIFIFLIFWIQSFVIVWNRLFTFSFICFWFRILLKFLANIFTLWLPSHFVFIFRRKIAISFHDENLNY